MSYQTYKEVSSLEPKTLRQLLINDDPIARLWAAWALGLNLGSKSFPDLNIHLNEEPEAGIRRHLLVIFAGKGETEILRVFAQDDPDAYVRATACQYLIRISHETNTSTQDFIRMRLISDPARVVRQTILTESPPDYAALRFENLAYLINDEDIQVRKLTIDRLLNIGLPEQLFPSVLEDRIKDEPDDNLRHELIGLCLESDGGGVRLIKMCYTLDSERTIEILTKLVDLNETFTWEHLAPLSLVKNPFFDVLLLQLLKPKQISSHLHWLLECLIRVHHWPQPRNRRESSFASAVRTSAWWAEKHLVASHTSIKNIYIQELDPETIQAAISSLKDSIQQLQRHREHDWEDDEWYDQAIKDRQNLMKVLNQIHVP